MTREEAGAIAEEAERLEEAAKKLHRRIEGADLTDNVLVAWGLGHAAERADVARWSLGAVATQLRVSFDLEDEPAGDEPRGTP